MIGREISLEGVFYDNPIVNVEALDYERFAARMLVAEAINSQQ